MKLFLKFCVSLLLVLTVVLVTLLTYRSEKFSKKQFQDVALPDVPNLLEPVVLAPKEMQTVTIFYFQPSQKTSEKMILKSIQKQFIKNADPGEKALFLARSSIRESGFLAKIRTGVEQVFFLQGGTAIVDLERKLPAQLKGSLTSELGLLRSIARTLTINFDSIKGVQFILGGQDAETLAGHISLATMFR